MRLSATCVSHTRPVRSNALLRTCGGLSFAVTLTACSTAATGTRIGPDATSAQMLAELQFRAPPATSTATLEVGLLSLQSPPGRLGVASLLRAYFEAIVSESRPALSKVAHDSAMAHAPNSTPTSLLGSWSRRFTRLRYDSVNPTTLYAPSDLEVYEAADVARLDSRNDFHLAPGPGELLAVVALSGPDELFGSRMELVLAPANDGFRIRAAYEDYAPR
jgi:hypothetical protein